MIRRLASLLAFCACAAASAAGGNPASYSAGAFEARLVDNASGEPVADAVVVALWKLVPDSRFSGKDPEGEVLKYAESVSGPDGRFGFAAWGPLARPDGYHLDHDDPQLVVFASGYYPRLVTNEARGPLDTSSVRKSEWNGRAIQLRRFTGQPQRYWQDNGRFRDEVTVDGSLEELATKIGTLQIGLGWYRRTEEWKNYPRMIRALMRERERLAAAGLRKADLYIDPISSLWGGEARVRAFLEGSAR
jgi:hypothetical protein